jgi:penicillin-binding protein 1A
LLVAVRFVKPLLLFLIVSSLLSFGALMAVYYYFEPDLPSVEVLRDVHLQTPMRIYTQDGKLISQYGVKRRVPLKSEQIPETLIQALLATEDSRFYEHPGVDPIGIMRALVNLILTGEKGQGGSTLTMQLARNFFLTREKTYIRKIREIFIAWHIEKVLSKNEILTLYINRIELGHRAFGFGAAAQVYYGKPLNELNLAQTATLAGLPQAPSRLNPISDPERSLQRRRVVLSRMLDEDYIDEEQFQAAASAPVSSRKHGAEIEVKAPYLADVIYQEMVELYGKNEAETGGYRVYATVPSNLQQAARQAVSDNIHAYDERHGYRGPIRSLLASSEAALSLSAESQPVALDYTEQQLLELLAEIEPIESLLPAVVTEIQDQTAQVMGRSGQSITIDWQGLSWGRAYISDARQGPAPKQASDVLSVGDVIWIRPDRQTGGWKLSQIPEVSGALVAVDPENGAAQAIVGGYSFEQSQFNRVMQAKRQIGSNIKPFIYSAALHNGYTLASIVNDAPVSKNEGEGSAWRPQNSPPVYDGPVRMRKALGKSKNVVSVRLLRGVGLRKTAQYLTRFGFLPEDIPIDETISIGSSSHTPLEVVTAMSVIANGGFYVKPYFIDRVEDEDGTLLWRSEPALACDPCGEQQPSEYEISEADLEALLEASIGLAADPDNQQQVIQAERVISAQNAYLVAEMMRTAVRPNGSWSKNTYWQGTGWRATNILKRDDLYGKTGTTNDSRDAWFSGFTHNLVATAWLGFDDMKRQLGRTSSNVNLRNKSEENDWIGNAITGAEEGAKAAQPAWIRFMRDVLVDVEEEPLPVPDNIVTIRIDRGSGKLTHRTDHTARFEYFKRGTEPTEYVEDSEFIDPSTDIQPISEEEEIF